MVVDASAAPFDRVMVTGLATSPYVWIVGPGVDVGILYLDHPTDVRNVYVPLTRGRSSNLDFVATTGEDTAADVLSR